MRSEVRNPEEAYLLRCDNQDLRKYMQSNTLLTGPDEETNRAVLALMRSGPEIRVPASATEVRLLEEGDERHEFYGALEALCRKLGRDVDETRGNFGWKLGLVESLNPERVLSVGCGDGDELLALRAVFPNAAIDAVDWGGGPPRELLETAGASYNQQDITAGVASRYDLIFSSHVLEHLYDPDRALAGFRALLKPGGTMVSALPMDGEADHVMRARLRDWAQSPGTVSRLDAGWLDAGHPWKTNPPDLSETLQRAGFASVSLYARAYALSRDRAMNAAELDRARSDGGRNNAILRGLKRLAFPFEGIRALRRVLLGIDSRLWFGDNRLKNLTSREVTFVASL